MDWVFVLWFVRIRMLVFVLIVVLVLVNMWLRFVFKLFVNIVDIMVFLKFGWMVDFSWLVWLFVKIGVLSWIWWMFFLVGCSKFFFVLSNVIVDVINCLWIVLIGGFVIWVNSCLK